MASWRRSCREGLEIRPSVGKGLGLFTTKALEEVRGGERSHARRAHSSRSHVGFADLSCMIGFGGCFWMGPQGRRLLGVVLKLLGHVRPFR